MSVTDVYTLVRCVQCDGLIDDNDKSVARGEGFAHATCAPYFDRENPPLYCATCGVEWTAENADGHDWTSA